VRCERGPQAAQVERQASAGFVGHDDHRQRG
jgi:hypothetical protein